MHYTSLKRSTCNHCALLRLSWKNVAKHLQQLGPSTPRARIVSGELPAARGAAATPPIRLAEMSQPEFVVSEGTSNALLTVIIKVHPKEITANWDELPADVN